MALLPKIRLRREKLESRPDFDAERADVVSEEVACRPRLIDLVLQESDAFSKSPLASYLRFSGRCASLMV